MLQETDKRNINRDKDVNMSRNAPLRRAQLCNERFFSDFELGTRTFHVKVTFHVNLKNIDNVEDKNFYGISKVG